MDASTSAARLARFCRMRVPSARLTTLDGVVLTGRMDGMDHSDNDQNAFRTLLHAQRVWDTELPEFDPATAPGRPLPLFYRWFAEAVAAGQVEPHTMTLATVDERGFPTYGR